MPGDEDAILGRDEVWLDVVGTLRNRELIRGERMLRQVAGRASMPENQRFRFPPSLDPCDIQPPHSFFVTASNMKADARNRVHWTKVPEMLWSSECETRFRPNPYLVDLADFVRPARRPRAVATVDRFGRPERRRRCFAADHRRRRRSSNCFGARSNIRLRSQPRALRGLRHESGPRSVKSPRPYRAGLHRRSPRDPDPTATAESPAYPRRASLCTPYAQ